jgi:hypothetical protein
VILLQGRCVIYVGEHPTYLNSHQPRSFFLWLKLKIILPLVTVQWGALQRTNRIWIHIFRFWLNVVEHRPQNELSFRAKICSVQFQGYRWIAYSLPHLNTEYVSIVTGSCDVESNVNKGLRLITEPTLIKRNIKWHDTFTSVSTQPKGLCNGSFQTCIVEVFGLNLDRDSCHPDTSQICHDRLLPNPFQFINNTLIIQSTLYILVLGTGVVVKLIVEM